MLCPRGGRAAGKGEFHMAEENKEFTFENEQYRQTYWHTCSHIMAQAVKRLWP